MPRSHAIVVNRNYKIVISRMSGRSTSVLASYNPLTDPHLAAHYSNRRRRKQLKSAGLVNYSCFINVNISHLRYEKMEKLYLSVNGCCKIKIKKQEVT